MNKKILIAGHVCLDITPIFPDKKVSHPSEILLPGKLIKMGEADIHTGGVVSNTGLALSILGADVFLVGKIGCDNFGDIIYNIFETYGAGKHLVRCPKESTSYSVVLAIPGTDRIFLHNPGANDTFCSQDISDELLNEVALFHFGYPTLMKSMYESNGRELALMLKRVKEFGVATSLDMAAIDADSNAAKADWNAILKNVLPYVDFFVPSVEELCFMLDKDRFCDWENRAGGRDITEILNPEKDVAPLADICMSYGAKVLLIKCGAPGIFYKTAQESVLSEIGSRIELNHTLWADKEGFEKSYIPDAVLSGTGAGDTSIAAFLSCVLNGESLETALQLATATGACCVTSYDALSGLKPLNELKSRIQSGWKKRES